MSVQIALAQKY